MDPNDSIEEHQDAHRRRDNRQRRVDILKQWQEGRDIDGRPTRERWSREARRSQAHSSSSFPTDLKLELLGEGMVVTRHRRTCLIRLSDRREVECRYGSALSGSESPQIAVGDLVLYGREPLSGDYYLSEILPRRSKLSRPGPPDREHREQLLAANIDQLIVVITAAQPPFRPGFVDRYLLVAEWSDLPLVLVINKIDLIDEIPPEVWEFEGLVEKIIPVSAFDGRGIPELAELLRGKQSVLTGHSGVGKSSLVQRLVPGASLPIGVVRADGKGRHTTVASTLHDLPDGGMVIDTPGIRGLGIWRADPALLPLLFPPFRPFVGKCRFADCRHLEEPGCAVEAAFARGEIPERFRKGYRKILEELELEQEQS